MKTKTIPLEMGDADWPRVTVSILTFKRKDELKNDIEQNIPRIGLPKGQARNYRM